MTTQSILVKGHGNLLYTVIIETTEKFCLLIVTDFLSSSEFKSFLPYLLLVCEKCIFCQFFFFLKGGAYLGVFTCIGRELSYVLRILYNTLDSKVFHAISIWHRTQVQVLSNFAQ